MKKVKKNFGFLPLYLMIFIKHEKSVDSWENFFLCLHKTAIEREIRVLRKTENKRKDVETRIKDLEQENQELTAENSSDKKTLAALREELVNEKIQTQVCEDQIVSWKSLNSLISVQFTFGNLSINNQ